MITLKFKRRPDLIHPEERQKHISSIDATMAILIEMVNCDESIFNSYGDNVLSVLGGLSSLKFDLTTSIEEEIEDTE